MKLPRGFSASLIIVYLGSLTTIAYARQFYPWIGKPRPICRCEDPGDPFAVAVDIFTSTEGGAEKRTECMTRFPDADTIKPEKGCPEPTVGICLEACASDDECNDGELCCSNGCGHECKKATSKICYNICDTNPCSGTPTVECIDGDSAKNKPGSCPTITDSMRMLQENHCQLGDDSECEGRKKCCRLSGMNGVSANECTEPVGTVSEFVTCGSCPLARWQCIWSSSSGLSFPQCSADTMCEVGHLCCDCPRSSGAGPLCMNADIRKRLNTVHLP